MRRGFALAAALALSACVFSSEAPFFEPHQGDHPIANGAHYQWIESEGERLIVSFELARDGTYSLDDSNPGEDPIRGVVFAPVGDTPQEDYIVQMRLQKDDGGVGYAFMWRRGDGYRVVSDPGRLAGDGDFPGSAAGRCQWQTYRECAVSDRVDLFLIYRLAVYEPFVVGGGEPESYVDLLPVNAETNAPRAPRTTPPKRGAH